MVKTILSDFSRVILFPKDKNYLGRLGSLHKELQQKEDYPFFDYFEFNDKLLKYYDNIHKDYKLAVFTESAGIMKVPVVKARMEKTFDWIFTTHDIGLPKADPRAFIEVIRQLKDEPEEILFIDDRTANLDAAKKAGLQTLQYFSNSRLFDDLSALYGIAK